MNASRFALPALALLLCAHGAPAQTISEETLQRMQQQIRKDRFDHVLPRAMRDNNVDMWIHVVRDRNPDPIARDLGGESGVFVFTDRGGDRIERAILGMTDETLWEDEAYHLFAGEGYFVADLGANGYVLREGETELPPRVRRIWHHAMQVRKILRANIRVGPTAGETLALLIEKLEEAGFLYVDEDRYDPTLDPTKTQVHLDLHAQGRRDMDAPRISPLGGDWQRDMKLPLFHSFTLEYMVHMPVPEWGPGKHMYIAFHDGAIVTPRGIEFPYPPDPGVRLIR